MELRKLKTESTQVYIQRKATPDRGGFFSEKYSQAAATLVRERGFFHTRGFPASCNQTKMKTKSLLVIAGIFALMGISQAEEGKKPAKEKKAVSPELLEKYDKDKDGKLSKEERVELKKDKAAEKKAKSETGKKKKGVSPEVLEKYDKDKDGKLSKEERAEMKKDKKTKAKGKKKKAKKEDAEN